VLSLSPGPSLQAQSRFRRFRLRQNRFRPTPHVTCLDVTPLPREDARPLSEDAGDELGRPGDRFPCSRGFPGEARKDPRVRQLNAKRTDSTPAPASTPKYSMFRCDPIALPRRFPQMMRHLPGLPSERF
jgi:hypothetical protein